VASEGAFAPPVRPRATVLDQSMLGLFMGTGHEIVDFKIAIMNHQTLSYLEIPLLRPRAAHISHRQT